METLRKAAALALSALAALAYPLVAVAQDATGPIKQDMDFTPVLLGLAAVALVAIAFVALRSALRRSSRDRVASSGRALQKP